MKIVSYTSLSQYMENNHMTTTNLLIEETKVFVSNRIVMVARIDNVDTGTTVPRFSNTLIPKTYIKHFSSLIGLSYFAQLEILGVTTSWVAAGINRIKILSFYQSMVSNKTKYWRLRIGCCNKPVTIVQLSSNS